MNARRDRDEGIKRQLIERFGEDALHSTYDAELALSLDVAKDAGQVIADKLSGLGVDRQPLVLFLTSARLMAAAIEVARQRALRVTYREALPEIFAVAAETLLTLGEAYGWPAGIVRTVVLPSATKGEAN